MKEVWAQEPSTEIVTTQALIAFGANLPAGDVPPMETVPSAMDRLAAHIDGPTARSRLFQTPAFPPGAGPDFVNAAMRVSWSGPAKTLLSLLHEIERGFGRTRASRWEARMMDLDLIAFGSEIAPDAETQRAWAELPTEVAAKEVPEGLILPHPRLAERSFVLMPLADVAPDWCHPITGQTVAEMLAARPLAERQEITPISNGDPSARPLSSAAAKDT